MTTVTKYICDLCHTEHKTEEECLKCELSHIEITKLDDAKYVFNRDYPPHVYLIMQDNHRIDYCFQEDLGEVPPEEPEPETPTDPVEPEVTPGDG